MMIQISSSSEDLCMFARCMEQELGKMVEQYAIVTILGPRQAGKATLARTCYPSKMYFNLEDPDTREMILEDPRRFLHNIDLNNGIILDEIQRIAELLSYIQVIVDNNRVPGSFILTGSHQLSLNEAITQSLAGRTAILDLLPLSIAELKENNAEYSLEEYLFNGFFPAIYKHSLDPIISCKNYVKTYVERDLRQIINVKDLQSFQRFIKLCAGRIGSIINRESLSNDVGVSQNTIKNWLSILSASYLTFQLQPYFENFGKRLIKSSKLYFLDVGLVSYLLGVQTLEQLSYDKMRGSLFENLVILEVLKYQYNHGVEPNIYFFRDSRNFEIDLILEIKGLLIPIEIKSSATFTSSFLKNIKYFQGLTKDRSPIGFLIYAGENEHRVGDIEIVNYKNINKVMEIIDSL